LIRLLISIAVIYILYKILKTFRQLKAEKSENRTPSSAGEDLVEDPVCHTYVPLSQAYKKEIDGRIYYFCSKDCSDKFPLEKNI